ncbi:MAG: recombinase family protein, partial [Opitutales bacterium]
MRDAFFRGTNLRPPAIGYKLAPAIDSDDNQLYGGDGERLMMLVICEETAPDVLLAFELYAESKWSLSKIGRHFNDLKVGDQIWDSTHVRQLLTRYKYRGIDVENMTYKETDPETGKTTIKERPRSEWWVRRARDLQIVPRALWKKTQRRLAESAQAYASNGKATKSRTEINPTTLVRPICGDCDTPMWLGRSGKYASFTCLNGRDGKRDCKNRGYKMVKIVETAIVNHVREKILTEDRIAELVDRANEFLKEEALKPRVDTTPWKVEIKETTAKRNRLAKVLETEGEQDLGVVVNQIRRYERQLVDLNRKVREAEAVGAVPSPVNLEDVLHHLVDLRGLLNQDVAQAEPVLREITGPVVVHIRNEPGKRRKTWIAEFTVNLVPVVAKLAAAGNCPSTRAWELLNTLSWTTGETSTVRLEKIPKYEALAPKFKKLREQGASIQTIASAHGMSWNYANDILEFARTGERPKWKAGKRTGKGDRSIFKKISGDVVRLRDVGQMSFQRIRTWLLKENGIDVSRNTLRRAYDFGHPDAIKEAAEAG